MPAVQREVCLPVIECALVQARDVRPFALVLGMTMPTLSFRRDRVLGVEAPQ